MIQPESQSPGEPAAPSTLARKPWLPAWVRLLLRWTGKTLEFLVLALLIAWCGLAIFYSNLPWPAARATLAVAFAIFAIRAAWFARGPRMRWALAAAVSGVMVWYSLIPASNDRPWRQEVARPPRALVDGDRVRFTDFRHFTYRTRDDFDVRYEEREVDMSRLVSLDLLVSYWKVGPVAHTFLSFNFDDGSPPVCISIETRPEIGEGFDPLASLFKQFELIYVVGDERDLVRVRTDHRDEEVFLYRLRATPEVTRALFEIYLDRINSLADRPEWYHLLSNSCTINVIRYSRAVGGQHRKFEVGHFLNGLIDAYLHRIGIIDSDLEFDELRKRSHINDAARTAGEAEDFSARIRQGLPGLPDQK
jgi:hypothetical protein